jgi:hypothetical protein
MSLWEITLTEEMYDVFWVIKPKELSREHELMFLLYMVPGRDGSSVESGARPWSLPNENC